MFTFAALLTMFALVSSVMTEMYQGWKTFAQQPLHPFTNKTVICVSLCRNIVFKINIDHKIVKGKIEQYSVIMCYIAKNNLN